MQTANLPRPNAAQLARLEPFERAAFRLVDFVNRTPATKSASASLLRSLGMSWVYHLCRNLTHLVGFEELRGFQPARGLIVASNHRSFFDLYAISCWLYRTTRLLRRTYFPVRAEFFYERPAGLLVNLVMAGLSMYPPVFRDPRKRDFNHFGLRLLAELLQQPGTVVGLHPEGRRGRGPDPYKLLPAQPGAGKLILEAQPDVLPVFINGLGNSVGKQIRGNFDGTGEPVIIVAGRPLESSWLEGLKPSSLRAQKLVADRLVAEISRLGEIERSLRARLMSRAGRQPRHSRRW